MFNKKNKFWKKRKIEIIPKNVRYVDYKDVELLNKFINAHGKILPSSMTGLNKYQQRMISIAIKRARLMALIPFAKEKVRVTYAPREKNKNLDKNAT